MYRARHLCAALAMTAFLPAAGLAQRQEGLQLFIEAGVRTQDAAGALTRVLAKLPDAPRELADALEHFDQIESDNYPLVFRMYTPGGWSVEESVEPPYFLMVLDSADELPIESWLTSFGVPERGAKSLIHEEISRRHGGRRYLLGNRNEEVRQELRRLRKDSLPSPSRAQQGLLGEVSQSAAYAFVDLNR